MIEKALIVGTANIRQSTAAFLENLDKEAQLVGQHHMFNIYSKGEYGWFFSVPARQHLEQVMNNPKTPAELIGLIWMAVSEGCHWIIIDRDATDETLPIWDW